MPRSSLALAVLVAWCVVYVVQEDRKGNAQELLAGQDEVVRDQVKGAMAHGRGDTQWRRVIGRTKVVDAHTLEFADGTRIELDINVPYPEQMALAGDVLYSAGQEAAAHLRTLVSDKRVMCIRNASGEGPWSAYVGDTNVERAMVVAGWALADHSSLHGDEIIARENQRGLWRGKFVDFDDWRAGVRLPGEQPPGKLTDERQARALLQACAGSEPACALLVERTHPGPPRHAETHFSHGQLRDG
jgi:endonuclease YncB( thermonuclease family)